MIVAVIIQTTNHIVDECLLRIFAGGLQRLHCETPDAVTWLKILDLKCFWSNSIESNYEV